MLKYAARRLLMAVPTLFLALTFIFVVLRILPGDPVTAILGQHATPTAVAALRQQLGLDAPIYIQYLRYFSAVLQGSFGNSLTTGRDVATEISRALPYTMDLAVVGIVLGALMGIPIGVLSAVRRNTAIDGVSRILALVGISTPAFYLGLLFMLALGIKYPWFPTVGGGDLNDLGSRLHHLALPAVTVGLIQMALIMRITRASVLDVLLEDYVRTARAKGLAARIVIFKHVLKNALIPIITVLGLSLTQLLTGAVVTETIFSRPGLGVLVVRAIENRDYTVLQGALTFFATAVVLFNLAVDLAYGLVDPRVRHD